MKINSTDSWQQLLHFVEQERGKYRVPLTSDTELYAQLGLEGDDAAEFLDHYATEFRVDMTGFDYHQYFGPEGLARISHRGLPSWWNSQPLSRWRERNS